MLNPMSYGIQQPILGPGMSQDPNLNPELKALIEALLQAQGNIPGGPGMPGAGNPMQGMGQMPPGGPFGV